MSLPPRSLPSRSLVGAAAGLALLVAAAPALATPAPAGSVSTSASRSAPVEAALPAVPAKARTSTSAGTSTNGGGRQTRKVPVAIGRGGAVATVDPEATAAGLQVLRRGGNAVDAAVAAAATLGVTEPYSAGIGGGGFFLYYNARTGRVSSIDGRETAPARMRSDSFVEGGKPIPFDEAVTSGLSVGVPGTPLTWDKALDRWGTLSLRQALRPAIKVASRGFVVDETFRRQTEDNRERFAAFTSTRELFLPGGQPPAVGTVFRNRDLARTMRELGRRGVDHLYAGRLGAEVVATVANPPVAPEVDRKVRPGLMEFRDLYGYDAPYRRPTRVDYRGLTVRSMAPPSSGGSTVGEALNILERFPLRRMSRTQALHHYLEASALAFADRNRYVGDPDYVRVPLRQLLSDGFARERACRISPDRAAVKPVPYGEPDGSYATTCASAPASARVTDTKGKSTTHLTVADRWGNVVSYTLTIEQTGGSGIVVPDRGFLLNNELTDFNFVSAYPDGRDPNLPEGGKRPRSSMSPTIVFRDGDPVLALGSPGGSTIITTVLQILLERFDLGRSLPQAIAAPRATQRNTPSVVAEPAFERTELEALGHTFTVAPGNPPEIGAAAAVEFLRGGRLLAAAEPVRRGGGSAGVVRPTARR